MRFKNFPDWLKGGIIGLIISIILSPVASLIVSIFLMLESFIGLLAFLPKSYVALFVNECMFFCSLSIYGYLFWFISFFILGSITKIVIKKIKSNMKACLIGGIAGTGIYILNLIGVINICFIIKFPFCGLLILDLGFGTMLFIIMGLVFSFLIGALIGLLVGWIIGKIKSK